jgi:hypothetical protein
MASKIGVIDEQEVRKRKGGLVLGLWSLTPLTMIFQFYWSTNDMYKNYENLSV